MEKKYEKCIKIKYNLEEHMQHTQHKVTQHNIDHKQTKKWNTHWIHIFTPIITT